MTRAPTWPARVVAAALAVLLAAPTSAVAAPTTPGASRAHARAGATALRLRVVGERWPVADARVTLRRIGDAGPPRELAVSELPEAPDGPAGVVVELEPGVWSLIARAPRHAAVQRVLTIAPGAAPVLVSFTMPTEKLPVVLQAGPAAAARAGVTWTLTHAEHDRRDTFTGATQHLSLEPGRWQIEVAAPGFLASELAWTVGEPAPTIELRPVPPPPVPRLALAPAPGRVDPRLGLGLGLGLAGAVSLGLGVGLLVRHRELYAQFQAAPGNQGHVAALGASAAGSGLVGAGLGLGAVALTAGLNAADRVLWAEFAVGGGVALVGSAWYAREWQDVQKDLYDGEKDPDMDGVPSGHDPKSQRRETAAASFIGAGAGLLVGAGAALLTRTLLRLRRGRPQPAGRTSPVAGRWNLAGGPGHIGLGLHGRF